MSNGIAQAKHRKTLLTDNGDTNDIIRALLRAVKDVRSQTADFSRQFSPDYAGLRSLFWWVKENIEYKEDPSGVQWIREPARLYADGVGDCKSYTLFIVSVLENIGLRYEIKFVNTERRGSKLVNHVYPVAILPDGEKVPVDAVYHTFDAEHPYFFAKVYTMPDIYRLSGLGATAAHSDAVAELNRYKSDLQAIAATIDDEDTGGPDITAMSAGEFARFQQAQLFTALADAATDGDSRTRYAAAAAYVADNGAGIGNIGNIGLSVSEARKITYFLTQTENMTGPAFPSPVLAFPNISGVGSLKDVVGDVIDDIKSAWKKVINWLFKKAMPGAAPFFLYSFLKNATGAKTAKRQAKQNAVLTWIQKAGQFDSPEAVKNAARIGIVKAYGKQPEAVLNGAAGGSVAGGVGAVVAAIIKVVTIVVDIIQTIAKLFKKKGPDVNAQTDAPDLEEMRAEYEANIKPKGGPLKLPAGGNTDRGSTPEWLFPAAAIVVAVVLLRK